MNKSSCQLLILILFALPASSFGQQSVSYEISFDNAVHHEAHVEMTVKGVPSHEPLQVRMSRSSPGRYAIHEFAKNVYAVEAKTTSGMALKIKRPNPYQWDIYGANGQDVIVSYTLFADRAGGTYSGIDETHAHLNIPATFMWARGFENSPVNVTFIPRADWKVATQLFPTEDPFSFTAPDLQYFMDSPTELSAFSLRSWEIDGVEIRLAVHHAGTEAEVDNYAEMAEKVTREQVAIYGELPIYDVGYYTFIADYLPYIAGDGMEHRNSTIIASTRPLSTGAKRNLGTLSHEYFHQWNVERIRPASLEPFDFEAANMSGALWFAEGFTSYYTGLAIRRAGITTDEEYASSLAGRISAVTNLPGRQFFSPIGMSQRAPFVDAAVAIDPTSYRNTFISYYTWGSAIGLALDLTLRDEFGLDLDGFMQAMWNKYGKTQIPYTIDDIETTLAEYSGESAFARSFFDRYIRGQEVADYGRLLSTVGFELRQANPAAVYFGSSVRDEEDGGVVVNRYPFIGSSFYVAGVDRGAIIESVDGEPATEALMESQKAGDRVTLVFTQRGQRKETRVEWTSDPSFEVVAIESEGRELSEEQRSRRSSWLGSRAGY